MQTKKLKYLLLFAVIAIAAAVAWYFAYWVKTPQYSLGLIGSAVQKHDFAAFEKHVDMETLYSSAYDDVVVASFLVNNINKFYFKTKTAIKKLRRWKSSVAYHEIGSCL